ncbi:(2Fe-2S)-binding protein [uncultured Methanolobus sp.]|uniref:(2Fe-2S)-binding protein n=1 Tax=uncultured Methanolobus sp. TaxID=218300 RepID=UPI0029C67EEC|nr:(2Fe-2S)-binding protein [uncultured Methanolobus sp.]
MRNNESEIPNRFNPIHVIGKNIIDTTLNPTNILCPVCKKAGMPVKNVTVRHIVKKEQMERVGKGDYHLCMDPECDVAYYDENGTIFDKDNIRVPLWFKKDVNPKYACYCSRITENDVIKAVMEQGMQDIGTIREFYDKGAKCQCKVRNPTGNCCSKVFNAAIRKGLELKSKNIY